MAMTYGHDVQNAPTARSYLHFLARRLARIYPLYAIITIVTFLVFQAHLSTLAPVSHPVPTLALNLLMIQAWGFATSIVGPGWSISTEWGAYLLFPLLLAGSLA
jgi:peptidoglycan/LPS O-acetylase OafA/YrhL